MDATAARSADRDGDDRRRSEHRRQRRGDPAGGGQQGLRRRHGRRRRARPDLRRRRADRAGRPLGLRQDDDDEDDQPAHRADRPAASCSAARTSPGSTPTSCAAGSATSSRTSGSSRTRRCGPTSARCRGCSAGTSRRIRARVDELLDLGRPRPGRVRRPLPGPALRRPAAAGRASPGRWPPTRRCCSWTSRSPPSTRSSGSGCRRSSCGCRRRCARRSCSSPTTSRRPCGSATGSR